MATWWRYTFYDGLQDELNTLSCFGRYVEDVFRVDIKSRLHLRRDAFRLRGRHVDLVKYRCRRKIK
jgi:hypothetical protein